LPVSSASDFERFSRRIGSSVQSRINGITAEAARYAEDKKRSAEAEAKQWSDEAYAALALELRHREREALRTVTETLNREWARFMLEQRNAVAEALRLRLSLAFPELAECFIVAVMQRYADGTFLLPASFAALVDTTRFGVETEAQTRVIFTRGHLYIEYSIERIIEELAEEIAAQLHESGTTWRP